MFENSDSVAEGSTRLDRVECDLSDVLGTPGTGGPHEVAARIGRQWGAPVQAIAPETGLFIRSVEAGTHAPPRTRLTRLSATVDDVLRGARSSPSDSTVGNRVLSRLASPTAVHQLCVQTVDGYRVVGGSYRIHAESAGRISVTGTPIGDLGERTPGPPPRVRPRGVADAMRAHLNLPRSVTLRVETVLFPVDGGGVWAFAGRGIYRTETSAADVRIIVRADDLRLLVSRDAASSAALGEADVYPSNPARDGAPQRACLPGLDVSSRQLRSLGFDVVPVSGPRPSRTLGDWRVPTDDACFDDVSAFYNLARAAAWFSRTVGSEVFRGEPFTPLTVITNDRASRDYVARFFPSDGSISFGDAVDGRTGPRCADICVHEFTHAVLWATRKLDDVGTIEARGLNEGYADYAQASLLGDPRMGDWVRPGNARDCSSAEVRFPDEPADELGPYGIGAAWAAVLWELREHLGPEVSDAIAFQTVFYVDDTTTVDAAVAALHAADSALFPAGDGHGRHVDLISAAVERRR